jgi:hypothetical protein
MRTLAAMLIALVATAAAGCGQRLDAVQVPNRGTVLLGCSARIVASVRLQRRTGIRSAMRRLEACMAEARLPGLATYDRRSGAVRYAYDADQLRLSF